MNGNLRKMKYQYLDTIIIRRRQLFILRTIGRTISGLSVGKIIIMILGFRVRTFRNIDHRGKKNLFSDWFACSKRKQFNKFLVTFFVSFFYHMLLAYLRKLSFFNIKFSLDSLFSHVKLNFQLMQMIEKSCICNRIFDQSQSRALQELH